MNTCTRTTKLYRIRESITKDREADPLATPRMITQAHNEASRAIVEAKKPRGRSVGWGVRRLAALVGA